MAEYLDRLLEQTPLINPNRTELPLWSHHSLELLEIDTEETEMTNGRHRRSQREETNPDELSQSNDQLPDVSLASPKTMVTSSSSDPERPPIIICAQPAEFDREVSWPNERVLRFHEIKDENNHIWESSQKEPLVEIPIRRTKQ